MKRSYINKVSKKQKIKNAELDKLTPPEDGLCQKCGKPPDWRGLARCHEIFKSAGGDNSTENVKWWCGKCHSADHGIKEG